MYEQPPRLVVGRGNVEKKRSMFYTTEYGSFFGFFLTVMFFTLIIVAFGILFSTLSSTESDQYQSLSLTHNFDNNTNNLRIMDFNFLPHFSIMPTVSQYSISKFIEEQKTYYDVWDDNEGIHIQKL